MKRAGVQIWKAKEARFTSEKPMNIGTKAPARAQNTAPTSRSDSIARAPAPRRSGSGSSRKAGASRRPGKPMTRKAACQGWRPARGPDFRKSEPVSQWISAPPPIRPRPIPKGALRKKMATARPSLAGGNRSLSMDRAAGVTLDSPTPTPTRVRNSWA